MIATTGLYCGKSQALPCLATPGPAMPCLAPPDHHARAYLFAVPSGRTGVAA